MAKAKKSTFSRSTKVNSPWLNNAMKSIGLSVGDYIKNVYPTLTEATTSVTSGTRNMISNLRQNKVSMSRIADTLKQNKYVEIANKAFKNAIEDAKTGNFNNKSREDDIFGSFGFDDFSSDDAGFSFGDDDEPSEGGTVNHVQYIDTGSRDAVLNLSRSVNKQSESLAKTSKASMDAQIAMTATTIYQLQQMSTEINGHLKNINSSLESIVEFNNTTMTKFVEASMAAYSSFGASKKDGDASFDGPMTGASVLNANGGLNLGEYKKYAKQQIKRAFEKTDAGMVAAFIDDSFLETLAANPLGAMTNGLVSWMMPKIIGNSIESVEKSFQNFLPAMLNKITEQANQYGGTMGARVASFIGEAFGIKTGTRKEISMAKVEKGPVPFDGETKHAITEIITKELREQTAYLKLIAEKHTSKEEAEEYRKRAKIFDYNANDYVTQDQIADNIYKTITDATVAQWNDEGGIGQSLKNLVNAQNSEENQTLMRHLVQEMEFLASSQSKFVELGNDQDERFMEILAKMQEGSSERELRMIDAIVEHLGKNRENNINAYNQQHTARLKAGQAFDDALAEIERNSSYNNLRNSGITAEEMKNMPESVYKNMRKRRAKTSNNGPIVISSADVYGPTAKKGLLSPFIDSAAGHVSGIMNNILAGNTHGAYQEFTRIFTDEVSTIGGILKNKVISPLKVMLLGTKDEDGNSTGGILSGVKNGMNDLFGHLRYQITGKGWKDSKGTTYEDSDISVVATLKSMGNSVKNGIMEKLFGRKNKDTGEQEKEGILSKFTDTFKKGLDGWKAAFLGEDISELSNEEVSKKITKKLHGYTKDATVGAAIGAGTGFLAGGSILGMLVGGPIGGAALGLAAGILNKGGKFQDWLFGKKDDETGERYGGFISRKTQDYIKEHKGLMIGGGAVGAFTSVLAGKSGGLLGTLVGGPIVGAGLGIATTLVTRSESFKAFLFGDESKGQEGIINAIKNGFKSGAKRHAGASHEEFNLDAKILGMSGIGVLGGVLASAVLPGGPIFGGLVGLGASIAANGETFKKFLFGEDYTDEDGNKKHRHGIFGRLGNMFNASVLRPLKTRLVHYGKVVAADLKYTIGGTVSDVAHVISEKVGSVFGSIAEKFTSMMNTAGTAIKEQIIAPMVETVNKAVFEPITTAVKAVTSFVFNTTRALTLAPFKLVSGGLSLMRNKLTEWWEGTTVKGFIDSAKDWLKNRIRRTLRLIRKGVVGAFKVALSPLTLTFKGIGAILGGASRGLSWAFDKLGNRRAGKDPGSIPENLSFAKRRAYRKKIEKEERASLRREYREQKIRDKNARAIAKATKGQYSADTAEARAAARRANPRLKLDTSIDTEDELARKAKAKIEGESVHGRSIEAVQRLNFAKLNERSQMIWILSKMLAKMDERYDASNREESVDEMEQNEGSQYTKTDKANAIDKLAGLHSKYEAEFKDKGLKSRDLDKAVIDAVNEAVANSNDPVLKYIYRKSRKELTEKIHESHIDVADEIQSQGTLADAIGVGVNSRINRKQEKRDNLVKKGDRQYREYMSDAARSYWRKAKKAGLIDTKTTLKSFIQMILNDEFAVGKKGEEGYKSSIDNLNELFGNNTFFGGKLRSRDDSKFAGSEAQLASMDLSIENLKTKSRKQAMSRAAKIVSRMNKKKYKHGDETGFSDLVYGPDVSKWTDEQVNSWMNLVGGDTPDYRLMMVQAGIENVEDLEAKINEVSAEKARRDAKAALKAQNKKKRAKRVGFIGQTGLEDTDESLFDNILNRGTLAENSDKSLEQSVEQTGLLRGILNVLTGRAPDTNESATASSVGHSLVNTVLGGNNNEPNTIRQSVGHGVVNAINTYGNSSNNKKKKKRRARDMSAWTGLEDDIYEEEATDNAANPTGFDVRNPFNFSGLGTGPSKRRVRPVTGGGHGLLGLGLWAAHKAGKLISKPFKKIKQRREEKKIQRLNSQANREKLTQRERIANSISDIGENVRSHLKVAKDHAIQWGKTFAKKGLITLALLAASPILIKAGKGIVGFFKGKWGEFKEKGPKKFFTDMASSFIDKLESAPLIGSVVKTVHKGFSFITTELKTLVSDPKSYLAQLPTRIVGAIESAPVIGPVFNKLHTIAGNIAEKGLKTWFTDGVEAIREKYPIIDTTLTVLKAAGTLTQSIFNAIGPEGMRGIVTVISGIGTAIGKILGFVGDIVNHLGIAVGERTNGMSVAEATANTVNDEKQAFKEIASGNVVGGTKDWIAGSDGEWDHESGAKTKFLLNASRTIPTAVKVIPKAAKTGVKGAFKAASFLPGIGGKMVRLTNKAAGKVGQVGAKISASRGVRAVSSIGKQATHNAGLVVKDKAKTVIDDVMVKIKGWITKVIDKVSKKGGTKLASNCGDDAAKALEKGLEAGAKDPGFTSKLASGLSKAASVIQIATITYGALNGISAGGAAKLFQINQSDVDGKMRIIASVFGAFAGSGIGCLVDLVNELVESATGFNFLTTLAINIYKFFSADWEKSRKKLEEARSNFKEEYEDYKQDKIRKAFETAVADDSLPDVIKEIYDTSGEDVAFEAFKAAVDSGEITVEYDSFADFNAKQNKSLASKAFGAIKSTWGGIKKGFSNLGDNWKTGMSSIWNGAKRGFSNLSDNWKTGVSSIWNGAKKGFSNLGTSIGNKASELKDFGAAKLEKLTEGIGKVKDKVGDLWSGFTDKASNAFTKMSDMFGGIKDKLADTVDGFKNGFTNGIKSIKDKMTSVISSIKTKVSNILPISKITNLANAVKTKFGEAADTIKKKFTAGIDKLKEKVEGVKNGLKGAWDKVKDWVTGGSGRGIIGGGRGPQPSPTMTIDPALKIVQNMANGITKIFVNMYKDIQSITGIQRKSSKLSKLTNRAKKLLKKRSIGLSILDDIDFESAADLITGGRGEETLNGFSYYSQNDNRWKNDSYSDGYDNATMGDSGCGPAAMSMIATQMTGRSVDPTQMASFAQATGDRDETGTNWNFINKASSAYGISSREAITPSASYVASELSQGHPMILSGASGGYGASPYTPAGHYVVATGIDSAGNVSINDPRGKQYSRKYRLDDVVNDTGAAWSFGGGYGSSYESKVGKVDANLSGDAYRNPINNLSRGQCTWYAEGRAYEKYKWGGVKDQPMGNGGEIYANALKKGYPAGTEIKPNSLVSRGGSSSYGHVLFVEDVDRANGKVYYSEANSDGSGHAPDDGVIKVQDLSTWNAKNPYGYVYTDGSGKYSDSGTGSSGSTSGSSKKSGSTSVLSVISQMISEMGTRAINGIFTGNWHSDYRDFLSNLKNRDAKLAESDSSSTVGSGSSSNRNKSVMFVGDSRTVGMYASVSGDSSQNGMTVPLNGKFGKHRFIGKIGAADAWLKDQGCTLVKNNLQSNGIIIVWMGVNNLTAPNYVSIIQDQLKGQVNGNKIYYLSVGPCEGSYSHLNSDIVTFNKNIKDTLPTEVKFIDIYSYIKDGMDSGKFGTVDGLHYNAATYQAIYTKVLNALGVDSGGSGAKAVPTKINNFLSKIGGYGRGILRRLGGGRGSIVSELSPLYTKDLTGYKRTIGADPKSGGQNFIYTSDFFGPGSTYTLGSKSQMDLADRDSKRRAEIMEKIPNSEYEYIVSKSNTLPSSAAKSSPTGEGRQFKFRNNSNKSSYILEIPYYSSPTMSEKRSVLDKMRSAIKEAVKGNSKTGTILRLSKFNSNATKSSGSSSTTGSSASAAVSEAWISVVQTVKRIFAEQLTKGGFRVDNVYSYSPQYFDFGDKGKKQFRRDCTGFISACLWVAGVVPDADMPVGGFTSQNFGGSANNQKLIDDLAAAGFTRMDFPGWDKLVKGDILIKHEYHGEIYCSGNKGNDHQSWNGGSGEGLLATDTVAGANYDYDEIWRPSGSVGGTSLSSDSKGSKSVLTVISSMMSEIGTRALNGAFTGKWDSNYDSFLSNLYSSGSDSSSDSSGSSSIGAVGGSTKEKVWNSLINNGFSKQAAAGVMGNINQESGFNEAVHQPDGGAGGLLQWDPWTSKIGAYAEKQKGDKLAWEKDVGMQMQYLYETLPAEEWAFRTNPSKFGAPNVTIAEFKAGTDIENATKQFEAGYERAGIPMMDKRIKYAKDIYDEFKNYKYSGVTYDDPDFVGPIMTNTGSTDVYGPSTSSISSSYASDESSSWHDNITNKINNVVTKENVSSAISSSFVGPTMGGNGWKQGGGRSGLSKRRISRGGRGLTYNPNQILKVGGRGNDIYDNISSMQYNNSAVSYRTVSTGRLSGDLDNMDILYSIIDILKDIATNTAVSSDKLDMLKNVGRGNTTAIITDGGRGTGSQSKSTPSNATIRGNTIPTSNTISRNGGIAKRIAKGV